jgi:hypothetical protein
MDPNQLDFTWPFTNADVTTAVNIIPNNYGRIRELNVFGTPNYIGTTTVRIDITEGVLNLLPVAPRGGPGTVDLPPPSDKAIFFDVPHIPHYGYVTPADIQNKKRPGTNMPKTLQDVLNDKLFAIRNKHAITLEWFRMGALKGIILDAYGQPIHNLYTAFGITPKVINFQLNSENTDVLAKCRALTGYMEDNLTGEVMSGAPRVLVDTEFMDALVGHKNVVDYYKNWEGAAALTQQDPRKGFTFGGCIFEEYRATASDPKGGAHKFIAAGCGHAYPQGTMTTFETSFAPADTIATANMPPDAEVFISQKILDHGKGIELYSESNPLALCKRPALLVKVTKQ